MARRWTVRRWFWSRNPNVVGGLAGAEKIRSKIIHAWSFATQHQQFWSSDFGTLLLVLNLWFNIQIHSSKLRVCNSFWHGCSWPLLASLREWGSEVILSLVQVLLLVWPGEGGHWYLIKYLVLNSLLTRALPVDDTGSMLSWSLVSLAIFLLGSSMGKVAYWCPLLLVLMARWGFGSICHWNGSGRSWASTQGCAVQSF